MASNKYSYLFNPKIESSKLTLIYCTYCVKVPESDRNELMNAYLEASDIAEKRELKEAKQGIYR
ncbi:MAG: hypothetical protein K6G75_08720 [Lachnospiraceae bacterium]|nr:hypothetical protein [Lachnospiraceae bacterium]